MPHRELGRTQADLAAARALIHETPVLSLAVSTAEGPWVAPVYYVYRPADAAADAGFYFFSSPDSRHIQAALKTDCCSAAIFRSAATSNQDAWKQICGLQMRGRLTTPGVLAGGKALARYLKKFPYSRSLLPSEDVSLEAFRQHLKVRFYCFKPQLTEWTDNRVRFGYRRELAL